MRKELEGLPDSTRNMIKPSAKKEHFDGKQWQMNVQVDNKFAEGASGTQDLGETITMRHALENLPRQYWKPAPQEFDGKNWYVQTGFAEGASGTQDLGETITMRHSLENLPR